MAFCVKKEREADSQRSSKTKGKKTIGDLMLIDIFESEKKYRYIIELLVKREMMSSPSDLWIDEGKGSKGVLVALLKHLYVQRYYKENTKLTNEQIKDIWWNTSGIKVSIDHVKRTKSKDVAINYIPHEIH